MSGIQEPPPTDLWSAASHVKIPEDAWEYQIRKSLNDAAYNGLDFVPYSSTMPVQPRDDNPKWIWKKKAAK
ncbi:hypothetical protein D9Q98_008066 [Chlorella vulgaris]|uniref:Uncharacterized protein n=1 Tax=Chlorella vulgaris TaxID=3077 RepID=A0A9D4TI36_CHLVU|nr:hypothetical protein D9Q98_008066 [Chlorella vulgaris]